MSKEITLNMCYIGVTFNKINMILNRLLQSVESDVYKVGWLI